MLIRMSLDARLNASMEICCLGVIMQKQNLKNCSPNKEIVWPLSIGTTTSSVLLKLNFDSIIKHFYPRHKENGC